MSNHYNNNRRFDPQTEDLFDYLQQLVQDQELDDHFGLDDTRILCEVLKVLDPPRTNRKSDWLDEVLPSKGTKSKIICFKGRILSKTGDVHIHSALPNPRFMMESPGHADQHWWFDLHPIFVGRQSADGRDPRTGEVVSVRFVRKYQNSGGEWFGFFEDFQEASVGAEGFIKEKVDPKLPFGPDARRFKPPPDAPELPFEIPKRILLVGDESFSTSPQNVGSSTGFANTIQKMISQFYLDVSKGPASDNINRLVNRYDIPYGDAKKILSKLSAFSRSSAYAASNDSNVSISEWAQTSAFPPTVEFFNASVAYADGSFFSKEGSSYHENKAGKITYKKPWKEGAEAKVKNEATTGVEVLEDILKSTNSKGQKFDFAIICGPTGASAVPGWAGLLDGTGQDEWGSVLQANADNDLGMDLKDLAEAYTKKMAFSAPDAFKAEKKKHFKSMLDILFSGGAIQGAVWLGPPIYVATKYLDIMAGLRIDEPRGLQTSPTLRLRRDADGQKQVIKVEHPVNDPYFDIRYQTSLAIKEIIEDNGAGKVYPCLAYCTKDFGLDAETKPTADLGGLSQKKYVNKLTIHNIPAVQKKNNIQRGSRQKAYSRWVIRMLVKYLLGVPGSDIAIDSEAVLTSHMKDANLEQMRRSGRFSTDRALINETNEKINELKRLSGKDVWDTINALEKIGQDAAKEYGG